MVTYYKGNTIPNSHIHMYDPDNVTVACAIFRVSHVINLFFLKSNKFIFFNLKLFCTIFVFFQDLCKFLRGELKPETEVATIQTIIGHGIEREELRDEIFVQCIRQVTNCPQTEWMERIWLLLCLCIVSFQPSKHLYKVLFRAVKRLDRYFVKDINNYINFFFQYFVCFLKKNLSLDGKLRQYVQWCLDNCNNNRVTNRTFPPSAVEISVSDNEIINILKTVAIKFLNEFFLFFFRQ